MHQVATLTVQLGLGSALVHWYRDATSVPFGHLLIDLSPRTDDRLRYCTNRGNVPSKIYLPDNLKHLKHLDDEHIKSLYSPSISTIFPRMQISVYQNLCKRFYPISQRVHRQPAAGKLVRKKISHVLKYRDKIQTLSSKKKQLGSSEEVYFRRTKDYCSHKHFPSSSLTNFLEMD